MYFSKDIEINIKFPLVLEGIFFSIIGIIIGICTLDIDLFNVDFKLHFDNFNIGFPIPFILFFIILSSTSITGIGLARHCSNSKISQFWTSCGVLLGIWIYLSISESLSRYAVTLLEIEGESLFVFIGFAITSNKVISLSCIDHIYETFMLTIPVLGSTTFSLSMNYWINSYRSGAGMRKLKTAIANYDVGNLSDGIYFLITLFFGINVSLIIFDKNGLVLLLSELPFLIIGYTIIKRLSVIDIRIVFSPLHLKYRRIVARYHKAWVIILLFTSMIILLGCFEIVVYIPGNWIIPGIITGFLQVLE